MIRTLIIVLALMTSAQAQGTFPSLVPPNQVVAGPNGGGVSGVPAPRAIVQPDLPFTLSGNAGVVATVTGALTNGHCVSIGSGGNIVDAGSACSGAGGGGTVNSATIGQYAIYSGATAVSGVTISGDFTCNASGVCTLAAVANAKLAQMPADTVKCNNTGSPATPIDCTTTQADNLLSLSAWNDASAVIGSQANFWTNSGPAIISRFDRVFVGEAALGSGGGQGNNTCSAGGTRDWLETLIGCSVSFGQISAVNSIGLEGVVAGTRTSDYRTTFGAAAGNSLALVGLCYNDDNISNGSPGQQPICQGGYYVVIRKAGNLGISFAQQVDPNNAGGTNITTDPYTFLPSGITGGQLYTAGSLGPFATANVTTGLAFAKGATQTFNSGMVFYNGSLTTLSLFGGSGSAAIQLPTNYAVVWYSSSGVPSGGIFTDGAGGVNIVGTSIKFNGTTINVP
jgi:hypothetical protein